MVLDVGKVVLDVVKVVLDVGKVVLDVGKVVLDVAKVVLDVAKVVLDVAKVVLDTFHSMKLNGCGLPLSGDTFLMVWAMATSGSFPTASMASFHVAEGLMRSKVFTMASLHLSELPGWSFSIVSKV